MRVTVDGVDVFCELAGEGTPVVTLHGFGVDHRIMKGCLEPVFEQHAGYQRVYFDLPGMGQTPRCDRIQTSDDMLAFVEAVVDRLVGNVPVMLIGESYGGYLARGFTRRNSHRVLGLGLICPMIVARHANRQVPEHRIISQTPGLLEELNPEDRAEFESVAVMVNPYTWRRTRDEIIPAVKLANWEYLEPFRGTGYKFSFDPDGAPTPFDQPVLILTGRQDASTGYKDAWSILEHYPHASYIVLDCAGHNLQIEQEPVFNSLMREWLTRCERATTIRIAG